MRLLTLLEHLLAARPIAKLTASTVIVLAVLGHTQQNELILLLAGASAAFLFRKS